MGPAAGEEISKDDADPSSLRTTGSGDQTDWGEGEAGRPACDRRMLVVAVPCWACNPDAARGGPQKSGRKTGHSSRTSIGQARAIPSEIQWILLQKYISLSGTAGAASLKWRAMVVGGNSGIESFGGVRLEMIGGGVGA
jgi:hypothetical protein